MLFLSRFLHGNAAEQPSQAKAQRGFDSNPFLFLLLLVLCFAVWVCFLFLFFVFCFLFCFCFVCLLVCPGKSPVVDGVVARDPDQKELRLLTKLTEEEREIARGICVAFKQNSSVDKTKQTKQNKQQREELPLQGTPELH